jgi:hypothetical protein
MFPLPLRRAALAVPAAVALLAATGCGASVSTSKTLKTNEAEAVIKKGLEERVSGTVTVKCPSDVKVEKGGAFDCTATADDGTKANVHVIQKDDQGNIAWKTT